ncbi:hypothetical protein BKA65DRAFT_497118 [Rhexocercosporidium sp. MPI-PUGE-AT-0058]|nr:hypothetical protein BKA65DRAFT_497118 [Rhexocercosporidium sp. MPI-PUGE-AT-0058]
MAEASMDIESILASYRSEATFEATNSLGLDQEDPTTQYKSGAVPYSYVEPSNRMLKVYHQDIAPFLSSAGVIGMVTNVSHGTFHNRPSTLVIFSFSLRSGEHGFRFKNANVKITLSKHSSASLSDASPAVIKFAPRKIFGLPTVEGRKNTVGGELTLQVPAGPVTVGPGIKGERETEYEKLYRFETIGNFWSSKMGTDWDIVYWDMRENKRTKEGIPDRLNVAVLVEASGPFVASVEVVVDTPFANGFLSSPWRKSDPAVFSPGIIMGSQPRTTKFDELTREEWRAMIPHDEEWENKLTDVAELEMRTLPVQSLQLSSAPEETACVNVDVGVGDLKVDASLLEEEESDDR